MNIRQIAHFVMLGLFVCGVAAAAPPPDAPSRNPSATNPVPARAPSDPTAAQRDQSAARKLLRADRHVRGRISHAPGYAARQSADIHREREAYLRSKAQTTQ